MIEGIVVNDDETPVPSVEVSMAADYNHPSSRAVVSGSDGKFVLSCNSLLFSGRISAFHKDYRPAIVDLPAGTDERSSPVTIALTKGASLVGRVIDVAGRPIDGAFVRAFFENGSGDATFLGSQAGQVAFDKMQYSYGTEARGVLTDVHGVFSIAGLSAGEHTITARALGFLPGTEPQRALVSFGSEHDVGVITLERGWRVTGAVTRGGRPVADAEVAGVFDMVYHDAKTDRGGAFVVGDFPPEARRGEILVQHPRYSKLLLSVELEPDLFLNVELKERSLRLKLYSTFGEPVQSQTEIELEFPESDLLHEANRLSVTPSDGVIQLDRIPEALKGLTCLSRGYLPSAVSFGDSSWDGTREEELYLSYGQDAVLVKVIDPQGLQVDKEADMFLVGLSTLNGLLLVSNVSFKASIDENGLYRVPLRFLKPDKEMSLTVSLGNQMKSHPVVIQTANGLPEKVVTILCNYDSSNSK